MASKNLPEPKLTYLIHFPTFLLIIGYPIFWLEMYWGNAKGGRTSPIAALLALAFLTTLIWNPRNHLRLLSQRAGKVFLETELFNKIFLILVTGLTLFLLGIALWAAFLPLHLPQELDAINYHYALPRQHLILKSFAHIRWSSADLWPLPIQFALAPYWFVTELPNKVPQFLYGMGLLLVLIRLARRFSVNPFIGVLMLSAILGSHGFGIQMGTAMIDVVICYLFLAALDSFIQGHWLLGLWETAFVFWAKPLFPIQFLLIIGFLWLLKKIFCSLAFRHWTWDFRNEIPAVFSTTFRKRKHRVVFGFLLLSLFIGGPFLGKSLYYSGTPFYPWGVGKFMIREIDQNSSQWQSLVNAAQNLLNVRDSYGHGRSLIAFVHHFWRIAVPESGVNNKYDYPLGLVYLLMLGPFLIFLGQALSKKCLPFLPLVVIGYWLIWWLGSQQSRFLFVPLCLMFLTTLTNMPKVSRVFLACLIVAVGLNISSVLRAHRRDLGLSREEVLRESDKELLNMTRAYLQHGRKDVVSVADPEIAYAGFPVLVAPQRLPYVLSIK
jgi:hypothetical protein